MFAYHCTVFGGKLKPDKAYLEMCNLRVIWSKHVYPHQKRGRFGQDLGNLLKIYKLQEQLLVWQEFFGKWGARNSISA